MGFKLTLAAVFCVCFVSITVEALDCYQFSTNDFGGGEGSAPVLTTCPDNMPRCINIQYTAVLLTDNDNEEGQQVTFHRGNCTTSSACNGICSDLRKGLKQSVPQCQQNCCNNDECNELKDE